jgi:hypothetical protein
MKKIMLSAGVIALATAALLSSSCNRDKEELEEIFQAAEDHALMEGEFSNVNDWADNQADDKGFGKANISILPACAQVTTNTSSTPKVLEINFYDSANAGNNYACLCNDGNYRRGKIRCEFTGAYRTQGSTLVVTLQDYFVNDIQYTGTRTITNLGNASGNYKYSYVVTGASAITPEGTVTWTTNGELERVEGEATLNPFDDEYLLRGTANGVSRAGNNFSVAITTPLKKEIGCPRIVSGKTNITNSSGNSMELDFDPIGGENCDRVAKITYKDRTRTITLR